VVRMKIKKILKAAISALNDLAAFFANYPPPNKYLEFIPLEITPNLPCIKLFKQRDVFCR